MSSGQSLRRKEEENIFLEQENDRPAHDLPPLIDGISQCFNVCRYSAHTAGNITWKSNTLWQQCQITCPTHQGSIYSPSYPILFRCSYESYDSLQCMLLLCHYDHVVVASFRCDLHVSIRVHFMVIDVHVLIACELIKYLVEWTLYQTE